MQCWWNRKSTNYKIPVFLTISLKSPCNVFCFTCQFQQYSVYRTTDSQRLLTLNSPATISCTLTQILMCLCVCVFFFSFMQGMFFLSFNLKFKFQSKFLTCFDGCDIIKIPLFNSNVSRYQWPRGLRRRSAAARLLRSWVRIPTGGMDICLLWVLCVVR